MSKENKETQIDGVENVHNALSKSEAFVEKNQKPILIGFAAVVLVICAILSYNNYYLQPKEKEAQEAIYKAQQNFARDSFNLALNGDGINAGFLEIIDNYGMTNTADLAKAYAGVSYKMLGEYEKSISYLKNFEADDQLLTPALKGAIGDCYLELGEKDKAISFYQKAVASNNDIISPIFLQKIGLVYLSMGDYQKAINTFEELKKKYFNSVQAVDADKYIEYAKLK